MTKEIAVLKDEIKENEKEVAYARRMVAELEALEVQHTNGEISDKEFGERLENYKI